LNAKLRPDDPTDASLLAAAARGDRDAFAALYDRHASILLGLVLRITRVRAEAEDVLQDAFLQIWQRAGDFDPARGQALSWMALIARSRALDRVRSRGFRERPTQADIERAEESEAPDMIEDLMRAHDGAAIRKALAEVPAVQRETLLLAYFEGLSQAEMAERLGKPLGTVKTHVRTGLLKLRDALVSARSQQEGAAP
jgi:RNA polymerase sigma-70 factor (ECF subfamily)